MGRPGGARLSQTRGCGAGGYRRIGHRYVPRSSYMKRIVQAHRLHHAIETKQGTVSFGFLYAAPAHVLKAQLADIRRS